MRLTPTRTKAPGVDLIEVAAARKQCNVDDAFSDDILADLVGDVTGYLEAPAGVLRVCLLKQEWREALSEFPDCEIRLPVEPLIGVTAVEYIAPGATTWTTIAADQYEFYSVDLGAFVRPVDGVSWPDTATRAEAVRVTYEAGFGVSADLVPRAITRAAKLMVGHFFENREATLVGISAQELPLGVQALLRPWFRIPV